MTATKTKTRTLTKVLIVSFAAVSLAGGLVAVSQKAPVRPTQPPVITSISTVAEQNDLVVTVTGTGFITSSMANNSKFNPKLNNIYYDVVALKDQAATSSTQLNFKITYDEKITGIYDLYIVTSNGTSNKMALSITAPPPPTVQSLSPDKGPMGSDVTIKGLGFLGAADGNIIHFGSIAQIKASSPGGKSLSFKVPVSAAPLTKCQIPGTCTALNSFSAGNYDVYVENMGGVSSKVSFTVTPNIGSISESSGLVGDTVTINGTGFTSGKTVLHFGNGQISSVTANGSETQLKFKVPGVISSCPVPAPSTGGIGSNCAGAFLVSPGSYPIYVTSNSIDSNKVQFAVVPPKPTISSISPSSGACGTVISVKIAGTNFVGNNDIYVDDQKVTSVAGSTSGSAALKSITASLNMPCVQGNASSVSDIDSTGTTYSLKHNIYVKTAGGSSNGTTFASTGNPVIQDNQNNNNQNNQNNNNGGW